MPIREYVNIEVGELRALQAAVERARQLAEAERRRAERAEDSARRAWQLAAWPGPRRGNTNAKVGR